MNQRVTKRCMYSALENDKVLRTYLASRWRKVQNYLQGQAMLNAALQNPNLTETERAAVKAHAQTRGLAAALGLLGGLVAAAAERKRSGKPAPWRDVDPATADLTEAERLAQYKQSERYQAYQARMQAWQAEQERKRQAAAWASFRAQEQASASLPPKEQPRPWWQRAWEGITTTVQNAANTVSSAAVGTLSPQKTGAYKLAAPAKDGPPWWEKWIEKGKEIVRSATEKAVEAKRWFTGENVGYTGSGWGHGPRQWVARRLGLDDHVGNVFTLVSRSLLQYDKVHLSGSVLEKIKTDPAMQELEKVIVETAKTNSKYGREAFLLDEWEDKTTYEFGGNRAPGDMWEQLKHPFSGLRGNTLEYIRTHGLIQTVKDLFDPNKDVIRLNYADTWKVGFNELTWATRHATVAAQVHVTEQGEIHIEYELRDELDLEPSPGRSAAYNTITRILGRLYHDILGGNNQMQVESHWTSDR